MNAKSEATIVTKMRTVPTFLAHITARAGLATQEMGAFVKVKLADKYHNKTYLYSFLVFFVSLLRHR